jgi:hypothetical protein
MTRLNRFLGLGGLAALAVGALAAQAARQLVIDGKVVSSDVTQEGGHYMVPLDELASGIGYTLTVNDNQAVLTKISSPAPVSSNPLQNSVSATDTSSGSAQQFANSPGAVQPSINPPVTPPPPVTPVVPPSGDTIGTPAPANFANMFPNLTQPQAPLQISTSMGQAASFAGFDYRVTGIREVGDRYKNVYDQRGQTLHPQWKTDTLVVIDVEVTNEGPKPVQAFLPSSSDITVFDNQHIGYHAITLDIRQSPNVVGSDSDAYGDDYLDTGSSDFMLGQGGTIHFAAIASLPKNDSVSSVMLNLAPGSSDTSNAAGAVITVKS